MVRPVAGFLQDKFGIFLLTFMDYMLSQAESRKQATYEAYFCHIQINTQYSVHSREATLLADKSAFNTNMLCIIEQIHDNYSGAHDVQLSMDSNIDLFQIN